MRSLVRLLLIFVIVLTKANPLTCQSLLVSTGDKIIYNEYDNMLRFSYSKGNCNAIKFKSDNGSVTNEECRLIIHPAHSGIAKLTAYLYVKGKSSKVDELIFYVKERPIQALLGSLEGGSISKVALLAIGGLRGYMAGLECQPLMKVVSYSVVILKNKELAVASPNQGLAFEKKTLELFKNLAAGDVVIFTMITVDLSENRSVQLNPIEFTISN